MKINKEEMFRQFVGHLKILNIRANYAKDQKAAEYHEMVGKLEKIKNNRHLAMVGKENEEGVMYLQLLDMISSGDNEETIYNEVKQLLSNYTLTGSSKEQNEIDTGEER